MKILLSLFFFILPLASSAQDSETPTQKYSVATRSFWTNWFVSAGITGSSFFGDRANAPVAIGKGTLKDYRTNIGFSIALGKWFTPGLGLRSRFDGIWGRTVVSEDASVNASRYLTLNEQLLLNFSNLFAGYSSTRRWNLIPYLSAGVGRNLSYNTYALGLGAGIISQWKLSKKLSLALDFGWNAYEPDFDGAGGFLSGRGLPTKDQVLSLQLGITYHFGRPGFEPLPDVEALNILCQSQIDAINAQLADEQAESERLRAMLASMQAGQNRVTHSDAPVVQTISLTAPVSVFFNIGSAQIASRRELNNVSELVSIARQMGTAILVTGYADSATGSSQYNQELSRRRAQTVADELKAMGFDPARITIQAEGGVDMLTPSPYNRRATVTLLP